MRRASTAGCFGAALATRPHHLELGSTALCLDALFVSFDVCAENSVMLLSMPIGIVLVLNFHVTAAIVLFFQKLVKDSPRPIIVYSVFGLVGGSNR